MLVMMEFKQQGEAILKRVQILDVKQIKKNFKFNRKFIDSKIYEPVRI